MASGVSASLGMGGALLASDIKLDAQNYREWSSSVRMLLRSIGLLSYITADPPTEKTYVKKAIAWRSVDDRVMGILCHNAEISIRMDFIDLPSSRKMWEYLQHRYEQTSAARQFSLLQTLYDLRQQDMSIEEYYSSFTRISRQLTSMVPPSCAGCTGCAGKVGHDVRNLMFTFVMRLRPEFESIRAQLLGRVVLPTMEEALAALIAEETRLRSLSFGLTPPQSVFAVPRQEVYQPVPLSDATTNHVLCPHCKKPGHPVQRCYRLHPELRPASHRRHRGVVAATTPASVEDSALATQLG